MRRKDKEIIDGELISKIINNAQVCRLALAKDNIPYIVPVSFGYDGGAIYFHTAKEGKKIDYITANNAVRLEFEYGVQLMPNESNPCKWTFSFQSVIGNGKIYELIKESEKIEGLNQIMEKYSGKKWDFREIKIDNIRVWKIIIETISGKQSKDKTIISELTI